MENQILSELSIEQEEKIINNVVEAVQILYLSVKARKEKEFVDKINMENERFIYGKDSRSNTL